MTRARAAAPLTWQQAGGWMLADGTMRYVLPVLTSTNRVWRQGKGRMYLAKGGSDDRKAAALMLPTHVQTGDLSVSITWYRQLKSGDCDNRIKATLDLLRGIAYADDASVAEVSIRRVDDGSPARLVVEVAQYMAVRTVQGGKAA